MRLSLYNENIEKVKKFEYLGLWLDETNIEHIETICKKM